LNYPEPAIESTPPTYSSAQTNTTVAGAPILFSILYDDDIALNPNGQYIFSTNNSGVWINDTVCSGTLVCPNYEAEASCNNCSQCNWTESELTQIDFESFDSDVGGWTQATFDTDDWIWRGTAPADSSNTGPNEVYDGGYMFTETSSGNCNDPDTAVLYLSPEIDFDSYDIVNVSMAYNMIGSTMGTLHIKENSTGDWVSKWSKTGDQGSSWLEGGIELTGLTGSGNVAVWMDCGASWTSDAAVDSINVTGGITGGCENDGACSSCLLNECNTNCSDAGCFLQGTNFTSTPQWANVTKTLNAVGGTVVGYRWYADDNAGNINNTEIFTLTTTSAEPEDTCTYTSGNWAVDCSDNCVISSPVDLGGNDISIIGTGTFTMTSDISNYGLAIIEGTDSSNKCIVTCNGGCLKN